MTDKENQQLHNNSSNGDQLDPQRIAQILKSAKDLEQIKSQTELSSVLVDKLFDFTKWVIKYSVETNTAKAQQGLAQSGQSSAPAQLQSQQSSPTPQPQSQSQHSAAPAQSQPQAVQQPTVASQPKSQSQPAKHATARVQLQQSQPQSSKPVTSSVAPQATSQVSSPAKSSSQVSSQSAAAPVVPPHLEQPQAPQDVQRSTTQSRPVVTQPQPKALHDVSYKKVIAQKSVHRLIFLRQPDGHMKRVDQWHRFTRHGQKNIQTGKVQWGKWNKTEAQLPAFTVPVIKGYHSKPTVIEAVKVTPESSDLITEVSYHADQEAKTQWPTTERDSSQNKPLVKENHDKPVAKEQHPTNEVATRRENDNNDAPERKRQQRPSFFKLMWLTFASLLGFRKTA